MSCNSTLLKSFGSFYALSIILLSNDALCIRFEDEKNLLSLNEKQQEEVTIISGEEARHNRKYQTILNPLIETEYFNTFKETIKKAIKSSKKIYKELEKHGYQHIEVLLELQNIISEFSFSSLDSYEDYKIYKLLDDLNLLLNKKKYHKDNIHDYPKVIANLFTDFREIRKLLPIIKVLFYVEDEDGRNIFEDFYNDIDSLEIQINEMKKYFYSYVAWLLENTDIYACGDVSIYGFKKQNDFVSNLSLLGYFGDKVDNRGKKLKESITNFLNGYYKCVNEEGKFLHLFVRILSRFNMYCENCDVHLTNFQKIMDIN